MGTNFYCRKKATQSQKDNAKAAIDAEDYEKARELINDMCYEYHIGKRSCGWAFLFQGKLSRPYWDERMVPWDDNVESLKEYLRQPGIIITDEYGREFTVDQLFDEEIGEALYVHEGYARHGDGDGTEKIVDNTRWCSASFA